MNYPKPRSLVEIVIQRKPTEITIGGYNYGLSGAPTSFYPQFLENMSYPIGMLDDAKLLYEPTEEEESVEDEEE